MRIDESGKDYSTAAIKFFGLELLCGLEDIFLFACGYDATFCADDSRIFDDGDIRIYDVRELTNVP